MPPFTPLYIDGKQVSSSTYATFDVRNPISSLVIGQSASASSDDCKTAVDSAAKAFESWGQSSLFERRDIFLRAADLVATESYRRKILQAMRDENAAMEYWCNYNWAGASNILRTTASFITKLGGKILPSATPGVKVETRQKAIGVILAIAPWNAPFILSLRAVAIPIICGNTVVLRSSEYSPRSQALVVELFHEAGLPKGVLNFLSMSRETAPKLTAEIIAHPMVRKINFTGSDRVGRIIAMEAAKYLKPCILELGGKAPTIVLDDADILRAAQAIVYGSMAHSGQICMSTERVILQKKTAASLISAVRSLCQPLKAGDPMKDSSVKLSALFSESSADNVLKMIREALDQGAELLLGDLSQRGAIIQPHLLNGVKPGMRLWEQESFGPGESFSVDRAVVVNTVEEAIQLANASEYSLTASVWTSNVYSAHNVSSRLRAGFIHINGSTIHSEPLVNARGLGGASGYGRFDVDSFTDSVVTITHPLTREYRL